ncbi:RNA polymerase sigma-70 factor [Bradyrhizobium sp. CCBAU 65884]|uniref:RNA polymerase sigma factor n=1 Tax=Bradyrhizobium sp. CCBAU 65884 TaxID=722477 RepID=UPI002306D42B|nr:RNA polymerase sigma factor [Bradyrhizobium sp. CCBAU 65884]MDA9476024.1 RNA polymerase sigma-70 factor [Bradyrhizobium sp. CCBAU 65884]
MKSPNESLPVRTAGSPDAQDGVVRAALVGSYDRLRSYLQRRFGGKAEAEEVLQAFMLRALERSGDIRDADSVRGWLSRVLATTIADFHRQMSKSRTREIPFPHELNERLAADPEAAANAAVCECLHTHLSLLKPEHAEVIRRLDLGGESRELVAADLGVTVNNLTVRLHRARHALKERLEQTCVVCLEESFWECRCADNRGPT